MKYLEPLPILIASVIFIIGSFIAKFIVMIPVATVVTTFWSPSEVSSGYLEPALFIGIVAGNFLSALGAAKFLVLKAKNLVLYHGLATAILCSLYKVARPDMLELNLTMVVLLAVIALLSVMYSTYLCRGKNA